MSDSPEMSESIPESFNPFFEQKLTLGTVCRETLAMAKCHGAAFVQVLLLPVGKLFLGLYGSMVLSLLFVQWATQPEHLAFSRENGLLVMGIAGLLCLMGLLVFFQGCWEYLAYWVSLCLNVQQATENRPLDFKAAYQAVVSQKRQALLAWLGLVLILLPLIPCIPLLGLPVLGWSLSQGAMGVMAIFTLAGLLLGGLLGLVWLAVQLLLSYGFQILALEDESSSVLALAQRSAALTLRRPWLTLGLQATLFLATNYVLTTPVVFLLRFAHLLKPLDDLHGWIGGLLTANWADALQQAQQGDLFGQLLAYLQAENLSLIQGVTDSVVGLALSMLLLPLGTMVFTLVYLHLQLPAHNFQE